MTRQQILQAASAVLTENGYQRTTINAVATRAEVGVNTVYSVFGTKANLVVGLIDEAFNNPQIAGTASAVQEARTGPAVVRAIAHGARVSAERGYTVYIVGSENSRADPQIADAMNAAVSNVRRRVGVAVERLIELKVLSPDLNLESGTDVLYFFVGPPAWVSLVELGWSFDSARDFLADAASRALLRRGRSSSS